MGSVEQAASSRLKVGGILLRKPALQSRLSEARTETSEGIIWKPEDDRVQNVVLKLARAHVAYEQNEPQLDAPAVISIRPLCVMAEEERAEFELSPDCGLCDDCRLKTAKVAVAAIMVAPSVPAPVKARRNVGECAIGP